jgi:programmed cell death protein 6
MAYQPGMPQQGAYYPPPPPQGQQPQAQQMAQQQGPPPGMNQGYYNLGPAGPQPQPGYYPQQQQPGYGYNYGGPQQQQQQLMMMHHHHHQQQQQQQQPGPVFNVPVPQQPPAAQEQELRDWFKAVDQKGTGRIDAEALRAALSSSGLDFRYSTAEKLIRMFDKDHTGAIEFNEFKSAHQFIQSMASGFRARDKDNSGILEGPEVREALRLSGYQLSEPAFQLMMRKFAQGSTGLKFDAYCELSIMIGACARVFNFYDRNGSGLCTFDFNTFFVALLASTV